MSAKRIVGIVIILAVLARIITALALGDNALPVSGAYDQVSYDMLAQRVLAGRGFSFPSPWYPFTAADEPTAHWSFLYTLYLAVVYALFGHHPLAARLVQVVMSGLQCWLAYRIGRRLFGAWPGIAAAVLTAGYAYFIFFSAALMTQTFYIIALLAAIKIALELANFPEPSGDPTYYARQSPSLNTESPTSYIQAPVSRSLLLGIVLGIGALTRQTMLLFAPVLLLWIVWEQWRTAELTSPPAYLSTTPAHCRYSRMLLSAFHLLPTIVVVAILILPWTIRNYLAYHDFLLLNSNSGYWFYSSNHPNQGTQFNGDYVAPIPENLKGLLEPAIDRALLREGIGFILADPSRFVLLTWSRVGAYFWVAPSPGSLLISNLSRLFSFGLYLPFLVYGLYLSRKNWRTCLPLYLYAAFDAGLCLISWSAPRYRLPTDALMMVFAGLAVTELADRLGIARWLAERSVLRKLYPEITHLES